MKLYRGTVRPNRSLLSSVGTVDGGLTTTRAHTPATAFSSMADRSGTFTEYAQNVPRYNGGALVVEEERTNLFTSPRVEAPYSVGGGTVVGRGTENGIDYFDIQYVGGVGVTAASFLTTIAAVPDEVNTHSFFIRLIDGSFTNVSNLQINLLYRDAALAVLSNISTEILTEAQNATSITNNRVSVTATAPALTADKSPRIRYVATGAYNFTIRVGGIQLELGSSMSRLMVPVRGTPASVTRNADRITKSIAPTQYASRNLWVYSEDFSAVQWNKINTTINSAAIAGPYTGTLADAFVASAVSATHTVGQALLSTQYIVGTRYTLSAYVKAGTMNFFRFSPHSSHFANNAVGCYYDLTTGATTIVGTAPASAELSVGAVSIGGGWWRVWMRYILITTPIPSHTCTLTFTPTNASTTYLGDGPLVGGYIWGAQHTQSDGVPAYTQTVASMAASHSKGTMVIAAQIVGVLPPVGIFPIFGSIYDDANNHITFIYNPAITSLSLVGTTRSVANLDSQFSYTSIPVVDTYFRLVMSWDTSIGYIASQAHNGTTLSAVHTETMALMPVMNNVGVGFSDSGPVRALLQFRQASLYQNPVPAASLHQLIAT